MGKTIEIMFDDLIERKQDEILKEFKIANPEEMNWDIAPIAILELEMKSEEERRTACKK